MKHQLTGLIAAPFTPLQPDGSLNLDAIEKQAAAMSANGVAGVFICGSTGEGVSLTIAERRQVAERWKAVGGDDLILIVHVGHECLTDARELAAHARQIGADAVAALGPRYFKPANVDDLVAFCAEIARAAPDLPFYYYHIPSMTGLSFGMYDFIVAARERIPNLAGFKFTHEDLLDFGRCRRSFGDDLNILFGRDEMLLGALALGARGAVGSTYNFAAPLARRLIAAYQKGDMAAAQREQARSQEMITVFRGYGGIVGMKAVMKMIGIDCGPVRLPLRNLAPEQCERLQAELDRIGFFSFIQKG
ncbi:MAG: dihydrodipicolinate synthase family protein [Armatimonadota bacterium]|nr:dihydrodipicolinate synthase family protein [Armatimonadota bacterium]